MNTFFIVEILTVSFLTKKTNYFCIFETMDIVLITLGALAVLIGFLGSILPLIPGPPIAWFGFLLLHFTSSVQFSTKFLIITAVITIIIALLDYFLPVKLTKKFGGSKAGERGAMIGTIIGIFLGPFGIILGPFVGAFVGEIIVAPNNTERALKVAWGSFVGFLLSTGIKLIWCLIIAWWFITAFF